MTAALVDEPLIARVMALRKQGKTQVEIAVEVRAVQSTVGKILRRNGLGGYLRPPKRVRGEN